MSTQVHIELWEEPPDRFREQPGPAHTLTLGRTLTLEEQRRMLQALCQFGRVLQLWLEAEAIGGG